MKQDGVFAFTISPGNQTEDYIKEMNSWEVPIYKHSPNYIIRLLHNNGMELLKEQRLLMKGIDKINYDTILLVIIAGYKKPY